MEARAIPAASAVSLRVVLCFISITPPTLGLVFDTICNGEHFDFGVVDCGNLVKGAVSLPVFIERQATNKHNQTGSTGTT